MYGGAYDSRLALGSCVDEERETEREREMQCTPSTKGKFARLAFSDARGEQ